MWHNAAGRHKAKSALVAGQPNFMHQANEALSAGEGEKEAVTELINMDDLIWFVEWATELAFFDDSTRLWELFDEGKFIEGQFRFTTKEFYEVFKINGNNG
jgi:hypothetical protein